MTAPPDPIDAVADAFPEQAVREGKTLTSEGDPVRGGRWLEVRSDGILDILGHCADELGFEALVDITAVDHLRMDRDPAERFGVSYVLFSHERGEWLRLKALVSEDEPEIASATALWSAANWLEREVWDMFGIRFADHPDLRRILMPEDFRGHPLRKDYPLKGRGEREAFPRHDPEYRPEDPDAHQGIHRGSPRVRR